jgi:hypothetical protein
MSFVYVMVMVDRSGCRPTHGCKLPDWLVCYAYALLQPASLVDCCYAVQWRQRLAVALHSDLQHVPCTMQYVRVCRCMTAWDQQARTHALHPQICFSSALLVTCQVLGQVLAAADAVRTLAC